MLDDTVCIVCGGARGLGEATAKLMAEYGASVVVCDLGVDLSGADADEQPAQETVDEIRAEGGEAMAHYGDVSDFDYVASLIEDVLSEYGAVHNITNFAGILRERMPFNMAEEEWDAVIDVHLKGHFNLLRHASAHWRERYKAEEFEKQRSFTGISSEAAQGSVGQVNYAAAKAGILGITRTAAQLHRYNIRGNAIWPRGQTRMIENMPAERRPENPPTTTVAPMPVFLASDEATDVTGNTFYIGGNTVAYVSNPTMERFMMKEEGDSWLPEEIAENFGELTAGYETTNTGR